MNEKKEGVIVSGVGGLYYGADKDRRALPLPGEGQFPACRKHSLLAGDMVTVRCPALAGENYLIEAIHPRRNALIRPPIANLDTLFVTFAAANPDPSMLYLDKLLSIAVYEKIEPAVVITKADLSMEKAVSYAEIYRKAGFPVFICSSSQGTGIAELERYLYGIGGICAFAGASGVGEINADERAFPVSFSGNGHAL